MSTEPLIVDVAVLGGGSAGEVAAADLARAAELARSGKDLDEHSYAVASVAGALARHCASVDVPDGPFVVTARAWAARGVV